MMIHENIIITIICLFGVGTIFDHNLVIYGANSPKLTVRNCLDESTYGNNPWPRRIPLEMSAYHVGHSNTMTVWELYALRRNRSESFIKKDYVPAVFGIFNIDPFSLKAGDYKIKVYALLEDKSINKESTICFLRVRREGALAVIHGGTVRNISPGNNIVVDGSFSLDFCNAKGKKALVYKWQCTQVRIGEFCKNLTAKEPKFTIPGKYIKDKDNITIYLTIKNEDNRISMTIQQLIVKQSSIPLTVWCTSNCPPAARSPNLRKISSFAASCGSHSKYSDECELNWQLYSYQGIVKPVEIPISAPCSTTFCSFFVPGDVGQYKVVVSYTGKTRSGGAAIEFTFQKEPEFSCKLSKDSGTSFDIFYLNCTFDDNEQIEHFDVYASGNRAEEKGEFITSWSPHSVPRFRLTPLVKEISVQATNTNGDVGEQLLSVTVTPYLGTSNLPPIAKIRALYFDSAAYSVRYAMENENDLEEALSRMRSIWGDVKLIKGKAVRDRQFQGFIHDLKLYAINDMERIPIKSYDRLTQVASIIDNVNSYQIPHKADPFLAKSLTNLCKKMASHMTELLETNEYPTEVSDKSAIISNVLLECESENFNENLNAFAPMPKALIPEMHEVVPLEETVTEDYEVYEEVDAHYFEDLEDIMEAVNNSLTTNFLIAENAVRTIPSDSKTYIRNTSNMIQLVYKHHGNKYVRRIAVDGIELIPSTDILKYRDTIFLSLTARKKNMFWFSLNKDEPVTYIANLDLVHLNTKSLLDVKKPHVITLEVIKHPEDLFDRVSGTVTVPLAFFNGTEEEDDMEEYVKIHRINLFRYQALKIDFHDMEDKQFMVVVKNFEVPAYGDFKNDSIVFNRSYTSKYFRNDNDYDSWFYVAILPTREMNGSEGNVSVSFPYEMTFSSVSCCSWSFIEDWDRTCKVGEATNDTHISCECDHLSVLSGYRQGVNSREIEVQQTPFEIEVQNYYQIYAAVLISFIVFCFLMMFSMQLSNKEIYFAADNNYTDLYAYLIAVQSGGHRKTTARIVIKITGAEGITTHVLNYPDPECKILQHGRVDWIVVTTDHCLGVISNIVLWEDDYGIEPIWVCNNITIHDMQTYETWFFKINETMSSCHKNVVVAKPDSFRKRHRGAFMDRHSWDMFSEDVHRVNSYIVRLILVYSKFITPLMIIMFCYGVPMMEASDSIDIYTSFQPDMFFFKVSVFAGFISFVFHRILTSIFKGLVTLIFTIPMIIFCNTALVIYGLWIPHYSNMQIIVAWFNAVALDIILYENIHRLAKEYIYGTTKISNTRSLKFETIEKEVMIQREFLYDLVGNKFVRDLENLRAFKKIDVPKKEGMDILRLKKLRYQMTELVIFGLHILIVYVFVLWSKDVYVFHNHKVITSLTEGDITRTTPKLSEVKSLTQIADYMNNTFIEGLNHDVWYGKFSLQDPGLLADFSSKIIGVARVRQYRVKSQPCLPSFEEERFLIDNVTCFPRFSSATKDRRIFEGNWSQPSTEKNFRTNAEKNRRLWMFRYNEKTGTGPCHGQLVTYDGGSYILWLGRNKQNSLVNLKSITDSGWIDRATRSILIEMLTYNANYNMFCSVLVLIERSTTGTFHTSKMVYPGRMLVVRNEFEATTIVVFIGFALWIILLLMNRINAIINRGLIHMKSFWNLLDLTIIGLGITLVLTYLLRMRQIRHLLEYLEHSQYTDFIIYFHLFNVHDFLEIIGAILVFATTVRLWKLLRFLKMFQTFEKTMAFGWAPYLLLIFYHAIVHYWFSISMYIVFGNRLGPFKNIKTSAVSLFRMYMANFHDYEVHIHHELYSSIGLATLTIYMLLCKPIYRFYVAAEMIAYIDAGLESEDQPTYTLMDYVKDEAKFIFSVYKSKIKRLRGGRARPKRNVYPKDHDIFYTNCVSTTTSSIKKMSFITMVLLRNLARGDAPSAKRTLKDDEANIMLEVCHYFLVRRKYYGDGKEVFFKTYSHDGGSKRLKFIDHRRMTSAKLVAETILVRAGTKPPKELLIYEHELVLRENIEMLNDLLKSLKNCLDVSKEIIIR